MSIDLSTVATLTHEQAAELVALNIPLHLPSLQKVMPSIATTLATAGQGIVLHGLPALTVAAAKALVPHRWGLHLTGLRSISRELGDVLAQHAGPLEFGPSLQELHSPALARRIAKQSRWQIVLNGLESLFPEIARALAYRGHRTDLLPSVSLNGLRRLNSETAAELNEHFHTISIDGLCDGRCVLEAGAGESLAAADPYDDYKELLVGDDIAGFLRRDYPDQLLARAIRSLSRLNEDREPVCDSLDLDSLTSLSPKQAAAIATFGGSTICLGRLARLTDEAALALSEFENEIFFNPAVVMSPRARAILRDSRG